MATLHSPMARCPSSSSARVTIPTGLVKSTIQAPGSARLRTSSAMPSTTGTVRSALANPPGPVVSWPIRPNLFGSVSSTSRASWPPTRSWTSTAAAPSTARGQVAGQRQPPGEALTVEDALGEPADDAQPVGRDVVQHQLTHVEQVGAAGEALDELGRVRAARADDGDLHGPAYESAVLGGHPLVPVMAIPSMKTFCANKKSSSTGSRNISEAAICSWAAPWWALFASWVSPTARVWLVVLFPV